MAQFIWHHSIDHIRLPIYQSTVISVALSCTIFEIFDVEEYCDVEVQVMGSLTLKIYARSVHH